MLSFSRTAVHPYLPTRQPGTFDYALYTPCQIDLLPGQRATVDFLLAVELPPGHRADLRLLASDQKLHLHASPLCEFRQFMFTAAVVQTTFNLQTFPAVGPRTWSPRSRTATRRPLSCWPWDARTSS